MVDGQKKNDRVNVEDAMYRDEDKNLRELMPFGNIPVIELNGTHDTIWVSYSYKPEYPNRTYLDFDDDGIYRVSPGMYFITISSSSLSAFNIVYKGSVNGKLLVLYYGTNSSPSSSTFNIQWRGFVMDSTYNEDLFSCDDAESIVMIFSYGFK